MSITTTMPPGDNSLDDLKSEFLRISGRTDLTDAQVLRYLNLGQLWLDRVSNFRGEIARSFFSLKAGTNGVVFSSLCRVINQVWLYDSDERTQLTPQTIEYIWENYPEPLEAQELGTPLYWAPAELQLHPVNGTYENIPVTFGQLDAIIGNAYAFNGVIVAPATDVDTVIQVRGKFYSPRFTDTQTSSWWLHNHFDLLLQAALRAVEVDYRNRAGVADWEEAMSHGITSIDHDLAEIEASGIVRMEG